VRKDAGVELDVPAAVDILRWRSAYNVMVSMDLIAYVGHEIDPVRVVLEVLDGELLQIPARQRSSEKSNVGKGEFTNQYDAGAVKLTIILLAALSSFRKARKFLPSASMPPRSVPGYSQSCPKHQQSNPSTTSWQRSAHDVDAVKAIRSNLADDVRDELGTAARSSHIE
jgi:hypothetical protein